MVFYSPYFIIKKLQLEVLKKYSGYLKGRVLDIGCGLKPYKKYLTLSSEYTGMDESKEVSPDVLAKSDKIPFSDGYFDSVLCTELLEHLPEPQDTLLEIKRVLKKGGYLYLTVPQEWCLHYEPQDYFRFTKYGIKYLLEKNGFEVIRIDRIGGTFSLIGQRVIDMSWHLAVRMMKHICGLKYAEKIASALCSPFSLAFYLLGTVADNIDKSDAIGWAVLAKK